MQLFQVLQQLRSDLWGSAHCSTSGALYNGSKMLRSTAATSTSRTAAPWSAPSRTAIAPRTKTCPRGPRLPPQPVDDVTVVHPVLLPSAQSRHLGDLLLPCPAATTRSADLRSGSRSSLKNTPSPSPSSSTAAQSDREGAQDGSVANFSCSRESGLNASGAMHVRVQVATI